MPAADRPGIDESSGLIASGRRRSGQIAIVLALMVASAPAAALKPGPERPSGDDHVVHVLRGHSDIVTAASFSPDGKTVVTASKDKTAKLWDVATGKLRATLTGHEASVVYAVFDPAGKRVVTTSRDKTARVWDARTGRLQMILKGHHSAVWRAGFSPDGTRLFTSSLDGTIRIWDAASGALLRNLRVHNRAIDEEIGRPYVMFHAEFSPDGTRILAAASDGAGVWNAATGELELELSGHSNSVEKAIFSPSGNRIATASWDGTARLWDAATGKSLCVFEGHEEFVRDVAFNPAGDRLVTVSDDRLARLWDPRSCKRIRTLAGHAPRLPGHNGIFGTHVAFDPAGRRLATSISGEGTVLLWEVESGAQLASFAGHEDDIYQFAFSPDGELLVTASADRTARLWSVKPASR